MATRIFRNDDKSGVKEGGNEVKQVVKDATVAKKT
jgi:hypothetical protein